MPITVTCTCGAQHQLPDRAAGRKARCKQCGRVYAVPAESTADAPEPTAPSADALGALEIPGPGRTFVGEAVRAFGLFGNFRNLIAWLVIALFEVVGLAVAAIPSSVLGLYGILISWLVLAFVYGIICSFCLNAIITVAGGEDELPAASSYTDAWDSVFEPLLQFVGTAAMLALPAVIALFFLYERGAEWHQAHPLVLALAAVGLLMWPVTILAVAMGGLAVFCRPDRLLRAVFAAPGPYVFIWLLLLAAVAIRYLGVALAAMISIAVGRTAVAVVTSLAQYYAVIVAMCLIGLFYRHYRHRFGWQME